MSDRLLHRTFWVLKHDVSVVLQRTGYTVGGFLGVSFTDVFSSQQ
jgi:hypothetical protein